MGEIIPAMTTSLTVTIGLNKFLLLDGRAFDRFIYPDLYNLFVANGKSDPTYLYDMR